MKHMNLHSHRTSVASEPFVRQEQETMAGQAYSCIDGVMTSRDIARAAGVKEKEARRALKTYCAARDDALSTDAGSSMMFSADKVPHPSTVTRSALALIVAERLQLGRFGLQTRIAERKLMSATHHPWNVGKHGRAVRSDQGTGVVATLTCSKCPKTLDIRFRQLAESGAMDRKFAQQGWAVDPAKCPDHNRHCHLPRKETATVPTATAPAPTFGAPTPAAIAAQAKMFGLLQGHFDPESGTYGSGYSDRKIAEECRLSVELVAGVRAQAFGELKVPSEVAALQADIAALEGLLEEAVAPITAELAKLRTRVAECCRKFGG